MGFDKCALIGYLLQEGQLEPVTDTTIKYETEFVGKVHITLPAYQSMLEGDFERYLIAGICKNRTLKGESPILLDTPFINEGYKKFNPPTQFEEKCDSLLKYLYEYGGKENREFELNSTKHFPIAYSDPEEFVRIVDNLKSDHLISVRREHPMGRGGMKLFMGVKVTSIGKNKAQKSLPKMPLFGLVNQEITTGNTVTDEKINHARTLFFDEPRTLDKMRSACETLSFVLEPLRTSLVSAFSDKDVSTFFQIVNEFDIRHNKDKVKKIVHEEQIEWIFYTLLNSINTYSKLSASGKI